MKFKNSVNNTQVFNRPCVGTQNALTDFLLAQKKLAELKPPSLVVTNRNAAINPQDQTEVPRPLPCILYIIFPNNGALPYKKHSLYSFSKLFTITITMIKLITLANNNEII